MLTMYLKFAWRYFKAKKSANAINIIAWVTTGVIAFATCCQILVLSVFNGFEDLVKSLYSSFYTDIKIIPASGKTFFLSAENLSYLHRNKDLNCISLIAQEKALLQNGEFQTVVQLKGVDENYKNVCDLSKKIIKGNYTLGNKESPGLIIGAGIQNATGIIMNDAAGPEKVVAILPKSNIESNDPLQSLSEGILVPTGVFSIQQDFDNVYAITNIEYVKLQIGFQQNEFSSVEIKVNSSKNIAFIVDSIQNNLGDKFIVQNKYQQNTSLYSTMQTEKWAIYAILTLILIIAAFNMISALTMLVLEKKQDIAILQSMGATSFQISRIFLSEGLLLGAIGTVIGIGVAGIICFLQLQFKLIKITGGSFLIDYFPVKTMLPDFLMVIFTAMIIVLISSWLPAKKAAEKILTKQ
jgi:lipoprotein-releasing system permease protein